MIDEIKNKYIRKILKLVKNKEIRKPMIKIDSPRKVEGQFKNIKLSKRHRF